MGEKNMCAYPVQGQLYRFRILFSVVKWQLSLLLFSLHGTIYISLRGRENCFLFAIVPFGKSKTKKKYPYVIYFLIKKLRISDLPD